MAPEDERHRHPTNPQLQSFSAHHRTQESNLPAVQVALQGDLIEKPMSYLLKAAAHYDATGHLHVGSEAFRISIQFGLGKVVHALSPFQKGDEAVIELFTWTDGRLTFENGRQPDKVTIMESNESLISRGQAYVADSRFLEDNAITEASFLMRASKLTPQELASTAALVPYYNPDLLIELYGNIYGTLNLKDAAARMNLPRSKWVSISAMLLRLGLLLSPEGKSLKSIDTKSLASAASMPPQTAPVPGSWPIEAAAVPLPPKPSAPLDAWLTGANSMPLPPKPAVALDSWSSSSGAIQLPDSQAPGATAQATAAAGAHAETRSVPLPKRTNESVTISIKKSLDEMKTDLGEGQPSLPQTASGPMIKTGISPDVSGYGPSDLNDFWRVINSPETGILNREMFLYMLSHEFSRAHRFHEMLTLAVFSVTFPKAADEMVAIEDVCQIIRAVEKVKREVDLFGHFGDRSFALLLPRVDSARTCVLVDRIHERLPEMVPTLAEAKPTIHFGLASAPADAATLSLLVKTAHANMQEAAGKGLHRLPVQQPPQQQTAPTQVQLQQPPAPQPQPQPEAPLSPAEAQRQAEIAPQPLQAQAQAEAAPQPPQAQAQAEAAPQPPQAQAQAEAAPQPPQAQAQAEAAPQPPQAQAQAEAAPQPPQAQAQAEAAPQQQEIQPQIENPPQLPEPQAQPELAAQHTEPQVQPEWGAQQPTPPVQTEWAAQQPTPQAQTELPPQQPEPQVQPEWGAQQPTPQAQPEPPPPQPASQAQTELPPQPAPQAQTELPPQPAPQAQTELPPQPAPQAQTELPPQPAPQAQTELPTQQKEVQTQSEIPPPQPETPKLEPQTMLQWASAPLPFMEPQTQPAPPMELQTSWTQPGPPTAPQPGWNQPAPPAAPQSGLNQPASPAAPQSGWNQPASPAAMQPSWPQQSLPIEQPPSWTQETAPVEQRHSWTLETIPVNPPTGWTQEQAPVGEPEEEKAAPP